MRNGYGGFYTLRDAPLDERYASKVDVLVPRAVEHLWEVDNYGRRDLATHSQPGLELCLVDHSPMRLGPVDASDEFEPLTVEVASILALLIAKGWKVGERFEQGSDAFREVDKDIADVYRLLRVSASGAMQAVLQRLPLRGDIRSIARTGARYIGDLCGAGGPGVDLLSDVLGRSEEAELILASLETLAADFAALVEVSLGTTADEDGDDRRSELGARPG